MYGITKSRLDKSIASNEKLEKGSLVGCQVIVDGYPLVPQGRHVIARDVSPSEMMAIPSVFEGLTSLAITCRP